MPGKSVSLGGPVMNGAFRLLLEKAARLHERHEAGRREAFNVFSVLRSEHDEVNLHSRFLAALLNHRQSPGEPRENLADFLHRLDIRNFDQDRATVDGEWNNIDIVICDGSSMQAVIIEHKIWAAYLRAVAFGVLQLRRSGGSGRAQQSAHLFRSPQAKLSTLEIHVLPFERHNLVASAPGQHEQAKCRRSEHRQALLRLHLAQNVAETA